MAVKNWDELKFSGLMTSIKYKKMSKTEELQVLECFRAILTFTKIILVDLLLCDYFKVSCHHNQCLLTLGKHIKNFIVHVTNSHSSVSTSTGRYTEGTEDKG